MASLAHAATGLGQGMLQQRELGRETDRYNQQLGLKEREIGLAERGFEADKSWREKQVRRQKHDKIQEILLGGNLTDTEKKYWEGQLEGLYAEDPELDITRGVRQSKAAKQAGLDAQIAADPSGASGMRNPSTTVKPGMFDTGSAGMFDPLAAGPSNYVPPPADHQPITDEQVSSLMRETDPQFNMQQNALRPPEPAPVAQPPTQAQAPAAPPQKPRTAREEAMEALRAMANDPNVKPNDRRAAMLEMVKLEEGGVDVDAKRAAVDYQRSITEEVSPNARMTRALQYEQIMSSVFDRTKRFDREMEIALEKAKKGQQLDPSDMIALKRLEFEIEKFRIEDDDKDRDRTWERGKDVAEHAQRDEHFYAGQEGRSRTQAEGTLLRIIQNDVTDKNPVTGAVRVKPGGLQRAQQLIREMQGRGEQVDPAGLNPGFNERIWAAVQRPGFNLQNALAAARQVGNKQAEAELKSAYSTYHKFTGAAAGGVSQAPPSRPPGAAPVAPANKSRIQAIMRDSSLTVSEKIETMENEGLPIPPSLRRGGPVRKSARKSDPAYKAPSKSAIDRRREEARRISQRGAR